MSDRVAKHGLQVDPALAAFIDAAALPGSGVAAEAFWGGLSDLIHDLGPRNAALLARREELQQKIDAWHVARRGQTHDPAAYRAFLEEIGYLVPEGADFTIDTAGVDPGIRHDTGAAAGGAGDERALRAECGECPLGLALRCALRDRRDGRSAPGGRVRHGSGRPGDRLGPGIP